VTVFTVHEPPASGGTLIDRALELRFVKEGFSWGAALATPVWLAARNEWIALAAYVALIAILGAVLAALGAEPAWVALIFAVLQIALGFEASELERWMLAQTGWREVGLVSGRRRSECERRFFDRWFSQDPIMVSSEPDSPARSLPRWSFPDWPGWRALLGMKP